MSVIQVETRPKVKSAVVRRMRDQGIVPMALLERGADTRLIQCKADDLREVLSSKDGLKIFPLSLDNDARTMKVIVKQIDRHHVTRKVTNIVLQEVRDNDKVKIGIPIEVTGTPASVEKNKSSLMTALSVLEVQGVVKNLPDKITVDVSGLGSSDSVAVSTIELPEDVISLTSLDTVVAATIPLRSALGSEDESAEGEATEGEAGGEEASAE